MTRLLCHYDTFGLSPRIHGNTKRRPRHGASFEDTIKAVTFIKNFATIHAMPLPGRQRGNLLPEAQAPKGLDAKRQWYLYEQIRPFCPTILQADLTCPRPEPEVPKPTTEEANVAQNPTVIAATVRKRNLLQTHRVVVSLNYPKRFQESALPVDKLVIMFGLVLVSNVFEVLLLNSRSI